MDINKNSNRTIPRKIADFPVSLKFQNKNKIGINAEIFDISEKGMGIISKTYIPKFTKLEIQIKNFHQRKHVKLTGTVVWSNQKNRYGIKYDKVPIEQKKSIRDFIEFSLLKDFIIKKNNFIKDINGFDKYDMDQIQKIIPFKPPFLRIEKIATFNFGNNDKKYTESVGMGIVTKEDTKGHYNDSIYLAMCGKLMGQTASIHSAILFRDYLPQVVEVNMIKPARDSKLWKPIEDGNYFFINSKIIRKKLNVVIVNVKIFFGDIFVGEVEGLKIALLSKHILDDLKELPLSY